MGGGDSQTTNTSQSQNQTYSQIQNLIENLATQGTSNQTSRGTQNVNQAGTTASQTNPWSATLPSLNNLLSSLQGMSTQLTPQQQTALSNLQASAGGIPNVGPNATAAVNNLYNSTNGIPQAGIWSDAYNNIQRTLSPYTSPNWATMNNPAIDKLINDPNYGLNKNIATSIASEFSGAGRDPVGNVDASKAIAGAESQADLPILLNNQNTLAQQQQNAAGTLFGAGGQTATGETSALQTPLMNQIAAMQASGNLPGLWTQGANAQLGAANQGYATPFQNIGTLQNLITQIAGLGGQTTGQTTGTQAGTTTGAQQGATSQTTAGSTQGTTSGQSQGNMTGTSTTTQNPNMFNEFAGLGLGLLSLMP